MTPYIIQEDLLKKYHCTKDVTEFNYTQDPHSMLKQIKIEKLLVVVMQLKLFTVNVL
jgi:hypothetical protein